MLIVEEDKEGYTFTLGIWDSTPKAYQIVVTCNADSPDSPDIRNFTADNYQ